MENQKDKKQFRPMFLHPQEADLILRLREKHKWGEVTIEMRDGVPFRLARYVEYEKFVSSFEEYGQEN